MSVLLNFKVTVLKALTGCPLCGSLRQDFWKSPEHFPGEGNQTDYLPHEDDKVAAKYYCGLELGISKFNEIVARQGCSEIGRETAEKINAEAESDFEEKNDAEAA